MKLADSGSSSGPLSPSTGFQSVPTLIGPLDLVVFRLFSCRFTAVFVPLHHDPVWSNLQQLARWPHLTPEYFSPRKIPPFGSTTARCPGSVSAKRAQTIASPPLCLSVGVGHFVCVDMLCFVLFRMQCIVGKMLCFACLKTLFLSCYCLSVALPRPLFTLSSSALIHHTCSDPDLRTFLTLHSARLLNPSR